MVMVITMRTTKNMTNIMTIVTNIPFFIWKDKGKNSFFLCFFMGAPIKTPQGVW